MHPHRVMLVAELHRLGILDKNLVSFQFTLDGDFRFPTNIDTYIEEYKMIYDDDQTYREKFEKYVKQVVKMKKT